MYFAMPEYYKGSYVALFGALIRLCCKVRAHFAPLARYTREFDRVTTLIEKQILDGFVPVCEEDVRSCAELLDNVRRQVNVAFIVKRDIDAAK